MPREYTMPDAQTIREGLALAADTTQNQEGMKVDMESIKRDYANLREDLRATIASIDTINKTLARFQGAGKMGLIGLGVFGTFAGIGSAAVGIWSKLK